MKKKPVKEKFVFFINCFIPAFKLMRKNDPLRLAGATSFFTTFALPPIIFILAQFFGLFFTPKMVGRGLIEDLGNNLGTAGAEQIRDVIRSIRGFNQSWYIIVLGFVFLFFVATTLFVVIKNSFNQVWNIIIKEKPGILFYVFNRLRSFAVILLVGILFFANVFFKSIETMANVYLEGWHKGSSIYFTIVFSEISSVIIVAAWFIVLFKYLADERPHWKAAIVGGILTAFLFTIGRFVMHALLINSNIKLLYGDSGSLVLVLLFVFYTSFILYYGACFIAVFSKLKGWALGEVTAS